MSKTLWLGNAFDKRKIDDLSRELATILPGNTRQQVKFIVSSGEAAFEYKQIYLPEQADAERRRWRLERLWRASKSFADAVERLDDKSREIVRVRQWHAARYQGAKPTFAITTDAARVARLIDHGLGEFFTSSGSTSRAQRGGPQRQLVSDLALAYGAAFHVRPSSARNGTFARALEVILSAADIDERLGEKALKSILRRAEIDAPAPRRGRRKRSV